MRTVGSMVFADAGWWRPKRVEEEIASDDAMAELRGANVVLRAAVRDLRDELKGLRVDMVLLKDAVALRVAE